MAEYKVPQINRIHITGNLVRDPELKYTPDGQPVCKFRIASTRRFMDKSGAWRDETTFVDVVAWRQLAERMGERLHKGSAVYVDGTLQSRSWETSDGQKRSAIEIRALRVQHLNKLPGEKEEPISAEEEEEPESKEGKEELPF
ncbi:MAG TPA: single-stranded DNA-binding protein [bacterium (Candidatus Stahlbacteria)]|nr:single-stranded DNA-binding protein [Candidatus Stahlbacteria bacterium]